MADCAAIGCAEPALEVWRPREHAPRFHYLVCEFHGLALRSGAPYTAEEQELRIGSLARLIDVDVARAGDQSILRLVYGDGLQPVSVVLEAEPSALKKLADDLARMYADGF